MADDFDGALTGRISLLDYLQQHGWKMVRDSGRDEVAGLCPLHRESRPSFYVNRRKQVFYCHGCGRGGGLPRLMRLLGDAAATPARLGDSPLEPAYAFYQSQLAGCEPARAYLAQRGLRDPAVIAHMRIGYAPGACLRGYLQHLGYSRQTLLACGLIDANGRDCLFHSITFPLPGARNLYGRALGNCLCRHRFLPGGKGGLYGWSAARVSVIVVEGLFDVAALWQAGFDYAVAALGSYLNHTQLEQLCAFRGYIYICFDADRNGGGQRAAHRLSVQLRHAGVEALRVALPLGHDPASYFAAGAGAGDFRGLLNGARP
jgi:DNA primase